MSIVAIIDDGRDLLTAHVSQTTMYLRDGSSLLRVTRGRDDAWKGQRRAEMRVSRLVMPLTALGVLLVLSTGSPVLACSRASPPYISDIVPGQPIPDHGTGAVVGVYEQEHIARSPWLVFISSRTVSVVTRYWGTPPPTTWLEVHGSEHGVLSSSSCGNEAGYKGLVGYN